LAFPSFTATAESGENCNLLRHCRVMLLTSNQWRLFTLFSPHQ